MKTRIITAAVAIPLLLIVLLVLPSVFTAIMVGGMCAIAAYELLYGTGLVRHVRLVAYTAVETFWIAIWCWLGSPREWGILGMILFLIPLFAELMASHVKIRFDRIAVCFFGGLILPYLLCSMVRISVMNQGKFLILIPFIIAFIADSGAYFAGRFFGKHKMAPVISPHKTVEGAVGGILASMLGMLLYGLILQLFGFKVNYLYAVLYGILGAVGGEFGDLCFSAIKRQTGIKDFGTMLPGHGGILDRFDSMVIVAPLAEMLIMLLPVVTK